MLKEGNISNKIALTIDIEDWYHLPPITGLVTSKYKDVPSFFQSWHDSYDCLTKPTLKTLDLLQELKIKATFFVVADIVQYYPGLVETIASRGHEIACHGLHHACKIDPGTKKPLMTRNEFKERTLRAKDILEKAVNQKVIGYRAPNAYIAGWMIDVLEELGFKYDSSVTVNSIYNKTDSRLTDVDTRVYYPEKGGLNLGCKPRDILEIPWPYFKILAKFPTGGGPLLRLLGSRYINFGLRSSLTRGHTLVYFHPLDMTENNFPVYTSILNKLFWSIKGNRAERRIKEILQQSQNFVTCNQISKYQVKINGNKNSN